MVLNIEAATVGFRVPGEGLGLPAVRVNGNIDGRQSSGRSEVHHSCRKFHPGSRGGTGFFASNFHVEL